MYQQLGMAIGPKDMPSRDQRSPLLFIIMDFSLHYCQQRMIFVVDGLFALVDKPQRAPAKANARRDIAILIFLVPDVVLDGAQHCPQKGRAAACVWSADDANDARH
jgi:hypothetical protein